MTDRRTAAAIRILSAVPLPESIVEADELDWQQVFESAFFDVDMSRGEKALIRAARQMWLRGRIATAVMIEVRLHAGSVGNQAVDAAIDLIAGDRDILDQDPMLDDTARESIWDRK